MAFLSLAMSLVKDLNDLDPFNFASRLAKYPSKWFEENPGKKPSVELPMDSSTLDQVRSHIKYLLLKKPSHQLSPDLVLLYFRKLASTMQARLDVDWVSFGVTIAKAGSTVRSVEIVDVKSSCAVQLNLKPAVAAGSEDDLWIIMALSSIFYHAVSFARNGNVYRASPEVLEQWKAAGFKISQLGLFWKNNHTLADVSSYRMMIAVFDMFLFRFPNHEMYAVRNLTGVSRFQGCAAYQSFFRLSELIDKDFQEIRRWMWAAVLQKEFIEITAPGQEMDQPYSYAPYFMVLELSSMSPYSEHANPNLYVFTNIVRATMNDLDARFARVPDEPVLSNIPINAFVFAYMLAPGEELDGLPRRGDFGGWCTWFYDNHSSFTHSWNDKQPPKALVRKLASTWSAFYKDPPESIGKMVYKLIR